jgi:hypothetical protein
MRLADPGRRDRTLAVAALAAVVGYHGALLFAQVRFPEPFLNDSVLHFGLIRALASAPARGQSLLDPWVPTWGMGFPVFHYYQNLPHLLVVAVWKAALGSLKLVEAFKLVEWLAVVTLPVPVYLAVRKLGFGRAGAVAAGTLSLWIKTDYLHGLDLESYTWQGLGQYTQAVGGWFLPLGIAWTYDAMKNGRGYGLATLFMTLTFLSHLALGYMGFMAAGLFALLSPREIPKRLLRLAVIAAVSVAASAYVVVPIFRDFAFYNVSALVPSWKYNSFGHEIVLGRLVRGELFDFERTPLLTALVGVGVVVAAIRARQEEAWRLLLVLFLFFLALYFGRPTWGKLLELLPLGRGFHYSRAIYLVHQIGVILAGVAAADLLGRLGRRHRIGVVAAVAVAGVIAAPLLSERTGYLRHNADLVQEAAQSYAAERDDLEAALALAREDRLGRAYAGQGAPGSGHHWGGAFMVGWTPVYAWFPIREMDALGYLHHMWSLNADMHGGFDERRRDQYRVFNVRRIVAPVGRPMPPFARELRSYGRFRVLEVEGPGFVELVDSPYQVDVPKKNVSRLHRKWLSGRQPAAGVHPRVTLLEEGRPVDGAYLADGVDIRLPEASVPAGPRGEVLSVDRQGDDFLAEVRVDRPCWLILKMSFHPDWRARVDGVDVEPVQLMPSYVGVALEPGARRVELRYEPGPLKAWLASAGLLILAGLFVIERRMVRAARTSE